VGKHRLLLEVARTTKVLNELTGVLPWDFTAITVLERKMDYKLPEVAAKNEVMAGEPELIEKPSGNVALLESTDSVTNMNEQKSIASVPKQDDSSAAAILANKTPSSSESNDNMADDTSNDRDATPMVSGKSISSSPENQKYSAENYGNEGIVNGTETCKNPVSVEE